MATFVVYSIDMPEIIGPDHNEITTPAHEELSEDLNTVPEDKHTTLDEETSLPVVESTKEKPNASLPEQTRHILRQSEAIFSSINAIPKIEFNHETNQEKYKTYRKDFSSLDEKDAAEELTHSEELIPQWIEYLDNIKLEINSAGSKTRNNH